MEDGKSKLACTERDRESWKKPSFHPNNGFMQTQFKTLQVKISAEDKAVEVGKEQTSGRSS